MSDLLHRDRYVAIKTVDDEKQIVYGEVYAPYVLDTYGEFMLPEDIEQMAHRFMTLDLKSVIDTNHDNVPNGSYPVETFLARKDDPDFTPGAWIMGVKVPEQQVWAKVKSGELSGFSFQALVKPSSYEVDVTVMRDHLGATEAADDGHSHMVFLQVDTLGRVTGGATSPGPDGHVHEIKRGTKTETVDGHSHRFFL